MIYHPSQPAMPPPPSQPQNYGGQTWQPHQEPQAVSSTSHQPYRLPPPPPMFPGGFVTQYPADPPAAMRSHSPRSPGHPGATVNFPPSQLQYPGGQPPRNDQPPIQHQSPVQSTEPRGWQPLQGKGSPQGKGQGRGKGQFDECQANGKEFGRGKGGDAGNWRNAEPSDRQAPGPVQGGVQVTEPPNAGGANNFCYRCNDQGKDPHHNWRQCRQEASSTRVQG